MTLHETAILFKLLKIKIIKIKTEEKDKLKAKNIDSHFADALHIVLATKGKAKFIVTRNIKDFPSFKTNRPEDL